MSNGTSGCSKKLGQEERPRNCADETGIRGDLLQLEDEVGRDDALRVALTAIELGARAGRAAPGPLLSNQSAKNDIRISWLATTGVT